MSSSVPTDQPASLQQWLLTSLILTALGLLLVVAAWFICDPFSIGLHEAGGAARLFLVLLAQVAATVLLVKGAVGDFDQLYRQTRQANAWWLNAAAYAWWMLLGAALTVGLLVDVFLLLFWLTTASTSGTSFYL